MDSQCCILLDMQPQQGFYMHAASHGLRTPNEGINQRYLKNWADVADKICCRRT